MCVCVCIHACIYVCMYVCMYVFMYPSINPSRGGPTHVKLIQVSFFKESYRSTCG